MARPEVPPEVFDKEFISSSVTLAIKAVGGAQAADAGARVYLADPKLLKVLPGLNPRIHTPSYDKHIEELKESIVSNGFMQDRPLSGFAAKDGEESVVYVIDGHSRLAAVLKAIEEGTPIEKVPVILKSAATSQEDIQVSLIQNNSGRPLSAFEKALVVKRLKTYGLENADIARRTSMGEKSVDNYLIIAGFPASIRNSVIDEKISASEALKIFKKSPEKAPELIKEAIKSAGEAGKSKATAKDTKAAGAKAEAEEGTKSSVSVKTSKPRKGKVTMSIYQNFKTGDEVECDEEFRMIRALANGDWWDFTTVEKTHAKINMDIEIDAKCTYAAPEEIAPSEGEPEGSKPATEPLNPELADL